MRTAVGKAMLRLRVRIGSAVGLGSVQKGTVWLGFRTVNYAVGCWHGAGT